MCKILDEGERAFLKWAMTLVILLTATFTLLLWFGTRFNAYGAETTMSARTPEPATKLYMVSVVRDPKNLLIPLWLESSHVNEVNAQRLLDSGEASWAENFSATFVLTLFDKATPNDRRAGANCNAGTPIVAYEVRIQNGRGLIRLPLAQHQRTGCIRLEVPDDLKRLMKKPLSGMLDWAPLNSNRPDSVWFVVK